MNFDPHPVRQLLFRLGKLNSLDHLDEGIHVAVLTARPAAISLALRVHIHGRIRVGMERAQSLEYISSTYEVHIFSDNILYRIGIPDSFPLVLDGYSRHPGPLAIRRVPVPALTNSGATQPHG